MAIEAVVFDIGNVLVEWHPERVYDAAIGAERRHALFAETALEAVNESIDAGAPFRETIYGLAEAHPKWAREIRMWHDNWREMFAPDIPHSAKLLRALRAKGVPVYALSNFGGASFDWAQEMYPVLREFDQLYVSAHLKCNKPDAEIYAQLERGSGRSGETLLFADDKPENIAAAQARGWHGHLFTDPAGWADRLVAEGLLSPTDAAP